KNCRSFSPAAAAAEPVGELPAEATFPAIIATRRLAADRRANRHAAARVVFHAIRFHVAGGYGHLSRALHRFIPARRVGPAAPLIFRHIIHPAAAAISTSLLGYHSAGCVWHAAGVTFRHAIAMPAAFVANPLFGHHLASRIGHTNFAA